MEKPSIVVQIVTYNSEKEIPSCMQGLKNQTYFIENFIIVDNQSTDRTLELIETVGLDNLLLIKNKENKGFAAAHNQALRKRKSDYVLVLNPDVELANNYIEILINKLEMDQTIGGATGKLYKEKSLKILDSTGIIMNKNRRAQDRGENEVDYGQFDRNDNIFGISGAAAIFRRKMIDHISIEDQFFDESFFAYKEDIDVCWRAQLFGWKFSFIPEALAVHPRGWNNKRNRTDIPLFIRKHSYINRYFYIVKNDSLLYLLYHLPVIFLFDFAIIGYMIIKEPRVLKSWMSLFVNLSNLVRKRKIIKACKKIGYKELYCHFKGDR